jgi:hypothetical protein
MYRIHAISKITSTTTRDCFKILLKMLGFSTAPPQMTTSIFIFVHVRRKKDYDLHFSHTPHKH